MLPAACVILSALIPFRSVQQVAAREESIQLQSPEGAHGLNPGAFHLYRNTSVGFTNLVVNTIYVPRPREMIHQLRQIAHASRGLPEINPMKRMFKEGDLVRVKYGPFRGVEGYVKREGARTTLCMNVDILGTSAEVAISPGDLEKVE